MKQTLIVLMMTGLVHYSATAQTSHSRNDINYKVCRTNTGYVVCSGPYNAVKETRADALQTPANNERGNVMPLSKGRSKYDVNYKVCVVNDRYKVCNPDEPTIQTTNANQVATTQSVNNGNAASLSMNQSGVYMGYTSKKHSNIKVWDEDNADEQLNVAADGKGKATYRNINYNNGSVSLPPSDGGLSDR